VVSVAEEVVQTSQLTINIDALPMSDIDDPDGSVLISDGQRHVELLRQSDLRAVRPVGDNSLSAVANPDLELLASFLTVEIDKSIKAGGISNGRIPYNIYQKSGLRRDGVGSDGNRNVCVHSNERERIDASFGNIASCGGCPESCDINGRSIRAWSLNTS